MVQAYAVAPSQSRSARAPRRLEGVGSPLPRRGQRLARLELGKAHLETFDRQLVFLFGPVGQATDHGGPHEVAAVPVDGAPTVGVNLLAGRDRSRGGQQQVLAEPVS